MFFFFVFLFGRIELQISGNFTQRCNRMPHSFMGDLNVVTSFSFLFFFYIHNSVSRVDRTDVA